MDCRHGSQELLSFVTVTSFRVLFSSIPCQLPLLYAPPSFGGPTQPPLLMIHGVARSLSLRLIEDSHHCLMLSWFDTSLQLMFSHPGCDRISFVHSRFFTVILTKADV